MLFNALAHFQYYLKEFSGYLIFNSIAFILLIYGCLKVYESKKTETQKHMLLALFFTVYSLIIIYSGFEAYFRFQFDESDSLGFLKVTGKWFERHVVFNSYFVRDRDFTPQKKPGVTRIGVVGDSVTMGYGIKDVSKRFSNRLEKKLQDAGQKVEVYNLGMSGLDTQAEMEEYNKIKQLNFDIVVWEYFLNDAQPKDKSTGTRVLARESAQGEIAKFLSERSYFFDYIYWRFSARYDKTFLELRNADLGAYKDKDNFKRHQEDIASFSNQLKQEQRKVVVIIFPFVRLFPNYPATEIHKTMDTIFKNQGFEVVDLLDDLKNKKAEELTIGKFDYHPNEYVQEIAAQRLYEKILPMIKK